MRRGIAERVVTVSRSHKVRTGNTSLKRVCADRVPLHGRGLSRVTSGSSGRGTYVIIGLKVGQRCRRENLDDPIIQHVVIMGLYSSST